MMQFLFILNIFAAAVIWFRGQFLTISRPIEIYSFFNSAYDFAANFERELNIVA